MCKTCVSLTKMYKQILLFTLLFFISAVSTSDIPTPCKKNDEACITKLVRDVAGKVLDGVPELDIEPADPMFFDYIGGDLTIVNFKLFNSTIIGYKKCQFKNVLVKLSKSLLHLELDCPKDALLTGDYEVDGKLINWRVEGKGDYVFNLGAFYVKVDAILTNVQKGDGRSYLRVKDFTASVKVTSPFRAQFNNLFNGNKELSDAVHQFGHENWEQVVVYVQDPLLITTFKKIFFSANKYLKTLTFLE